MIIYNVNKPNKKRRKPIQRWPIQRWIARVIYDLKRASIEDAEDRDGWRALKEAAKRVKKKKIYKLFIIIYLYIGTYIT